MLQNDSLLNSLKIKIYADLAELDKIGSWQKFSFIKGLTTNPSILLKAGVYNYEKFARSVIDNAPNMPVSFEVLADDFTTMMIQARKISHWGKHVYVKIPIVNCSGISTAPVIKALTSEGIAVNITAIMAHTQLLELITELDNHAKLIFSVFCGRIADTGRDPLPIMQQLSQLLSPYNNRQLLWASSREILNIFQANQAGCDIITLTEPLLNKLNLLNKDLYKYSIETVQEFYRDGKQVNFEDDTKNNCL